MIIVGSIMLFNKCDISLGRTKMLWTFILFLIEFGRVVFSEIHNHKADRETNLALGGWKTSSP